MRVDLTDRRFSAGRQGKSRRRLNLNDRGSSIATEYGQFYDCMMAPSDRPTWPLRVQIMLPMILLVLVTVGGLSGLQIYWSASRQVAAIEGQMRSVARTLEQSSFPLTDRVLQQMKGFAGAEFVLVDRRGHVHATTRTEWRSDDLPDPSSSVAAERLFLSEPISIGGDPYYHAIFRLRSRAQSEAGEVLHIFYSQDRLARERQAAAVPTVVIGILALLLVAAAASWIAARVTRPLSGLRDQVARIAEGKFEPVALPSTRDEIRQLSVAVNEMARMLDTYEATIRRTEQVRTLGQLGGALAHQLRNSATGARLAIDIHHAECQADGAGESLDVARRQLVLMEKYIRRFLALGARQSRPPQHLNMAALFDDLLPLVAPAAKHGGVEFFVDVDRSVAICGERDALEHVILNLLLNAVEAAATAAVGQRHVEVRLQPDGPRFVLTVSDSGAGPPAEIAERIFESFVTSKPDGVGLGLAIARQVIVDHGGTIDWERREGRTVFRINLPRDVSPAATPGFVAAGTANEE